MNLFLRDSPDETLQLTLSELRRLDASESLLARFSHYKSWCVENNAEHEFVYLLNRDDSLEGSTQALPQANQQSELPFFYSRVIRLVPVDDDIEIYLAPVESRPANIPQLSVVRLITDRISQGLAVLNIQDEGGLGHDSKTSASSSARIVYANQTLSELLAFTQEALFSSREDQIFTVSCVGEDLGMSRIEAEKAQQLLKHSRSNASDTDLRGPLRRQQGDTFLADMTRSIIRDVTGWCTHIVVTVTDVSQSVLQEKESKRHRQLNEKMQELAGMGWWELDLDTQDVFWSRGSKPWGPSDDQYEPDLGMLTQMIIPPDRIRVSEMIRESIVTGAEAIADIRVIVNGEKRWQRVQTQPGRVDQGRVNSVVGTTIDITDIVESETLRVKQHQELEFYLHHLDRHALIARLDQDQCIVYCNENFSDSLRSTREALQKLSFNSLVQSSEQALSDQGVSEQAVQQQNLNDLSLLEQGQNWHGEMVLAIPGGVAITLDATLSAQFDDEGEIEEIKFFGYDISTRKLAEQVSHSIARLNHFSETSDNLPGLVLRELVELSGSRSGYLKVDGIDIHWPEAIGPMQSDKQSKTHLSFEIQIELEVPGVLMLFDRPFGYDAAMRKALQPLLDYLIQAEARRRRSESESQKEVEHRLILESLKIGSWRRDMDTQGWYFNESLFDLLDYPYIEGGLVSQKLWDERVPLSQQLKLRESMKEMMRVDDRCEETVYVTLPNQQKRYIKAQGRLSRDSSGEPSQIIGIAYDVTKEVLTQQELENQKSLASHQARMASIGELAAGVGHEINNPLTIIRGFLDIVDQQLLTGPIEVDEIKDFINKMDDSASRIEKIVKGLRSLSHVDSSLEETFYPVPILRETIGLVDEIYRRSGIQLEVDIDVPQALRVVGYEGKLQQVLMNLLSNARDAVEGQIEKLIQVELREHANRFVMQVRDNGQGVPNDIEDKIFDPFFTTKEIGKGTGIGLSMVFGIVQEFGGEIDCETSKFGGAEFVVSLPIAESSLSVVSDGRSSVDYQEEDRGALAGRVLVVDDEEGVREFLVLMLTQFGLTVDSAMDGQLALQQIESQSPYDLVITDLTMPNMGGLAFIEHLQASVSNVEELPPILLSTGFPDFSIDLGDYPAVSGVLTKPYGLADLRNTLDQLGVRMSD